MIGATAGRLTKYVRVATASTVFQSTPVFDQMIVATLAQKIVDGDSILVIIVRDAYWEEGLNPSSSEEDYQQVGILGYAKGRN